MVRNRPAVVLSSTVALLLAAMVGSLRGKDDDPTSIRDDFETRRTAWVREQTDTAVTLQAHERSDRAAHDGRGSERFLFQAGIGSAFFYSYALPKLPITDELKAGLFVRSNRAGVRLYGRVVLPADTDPDTGQPSFVLVPGTIYDSADRWQRLDLTAMRPSIERQARVLRASTRRPVSLEGAYLERLVVNLFGGPGETEVFLDELTVGPVTSGAVASAVPKPATDTPTAPAIEPPKAGSKGNDDLARLELNRLRRKGEDGNYHDWIFTAIHAPGADVAGLRLSGFDVLAEKVDGDPARAREAIKRGLLLMPDLSGTLEGAPIDAERMVAAAQAYPFRDSVALWDLGDQLGRSPDPAVRKAELERIRAGVAGLRDLTGVSSRLTTGTVDGEFILYARKPNRLSMIGVRPNAWGSAQDPFDTYYYLKQRRDLTVEAKVGGLFWAWFPATAPLSAVEAVWGRDVPPAWGYPQIQPEQLRMFTFLALSAGYRGIGFRGDADLTRDVGLGRSLLIEMALLNEEIDLCQSILANAPESIPFYNGKNPDPPLLPNPGQLRVNQKVQSVKEYDPHPSIRAAAIATPDRKGYLLLVGDYAFGAQMQPPQAAMNDVNITIPVPESAQAFEISPGEVHPLDRERVPGGTRIVLPDFGSTAIVLVTTDVELADRLQAEIVRHRPRAIGLAIEQARLKHQWVSDIIGRLVADGHKLYDPADPKTPPLAPGVPMPNDEVELLAKSEESIKSAQEALEREDYPLAWAEARRASRPLRLLMSAHWSKAFGEMVKFIAPPDENKPRPLRSVYEPEPPKVKKPRVLVPGVASPPLVSFNTLPQHYIWLDWMKKPTWRNLLPSGSFDNHESLESAGWVDVGYRYQGITTKVSTDPSGRDGSRRTLKLVVEPTDKTQLDSFPAYLDFPAAAIRTPPIPVVAGQFLRITVWLQKVNPSPMGAGGIIVSDSIGGEALQFRAGVVGDESRKMSKLVLFRRAATQGTMTVTLGLAGFGEAYFDDLKVETVPEVPSDGPYVENGRSRRPTAPPGTAARRGAPPRPRR